MGISALLFVAILNITRSDYAFILLPVLLSVFINGSRPYNLDIFRSSTPLYLLLTVCLGVIYYSVVTEFVLLTHPASVGIIYVTVALAWAIILEPVRAYFQSIIERRFNVRNREAIKAVAAFTSTLREEIDLDQLRERFLTVIQQIMHPYSVSIWVRATVQQQEQSDSPERSVIAIASDDALIAYALSHPGAAEIDRLQLDSPLLQDLKARAVEIAFPLTSQGEVIGLLALGPRLDSNHGVFRLLRYGVIGLLLLGPALNEEEYAYEDLALLNSLAAQVAPALRVAQMVQEEQQQVRERERIEQELRTAQAIQLAFLPKDVPVLPGWQIAPYYHPAREVGGDFYDFLVFADGRLGLVIGDVTGKGIPAALVMATVHTMLRTAVLEMASPGAVLARVNDLLSAEIPTGMFVTCFYVLLDPKNGRLWYANAGHEPPFRQRGGNASELWATGMPLGMMPGTRYDEYEAALAPGESLLFYSDGLVEAHNAQHEMFGFPRLQALLAGNANVASHIDFLLAELKDFTGAGWEQEDDVTLVTLQRILESYRMNEQQEKLHLLRESTVASVSGNEQQAMEWMAEVARPLHLSHERLDDLKTAVSEAVMNAIEHGNHYASDKEVVLQVLASDTAVVVRVRDQGDGKQRPIFDPGTPDLEAKLAGREASRGWGLFLIKKLVDELYIINDEHSHTIEMVMHRDGVNTGEHTSTQEE